MYDFDFFINEEKEIDSGTTLHTAKSHSCTDSFLEKKKRNSRRVTTGTDSFLGKEKCILLLNKLMNDTNTSYIFKEAVSKELLDYHTFIKNPMYYDKIMEEINCGKINSFDEFKFKLLLIFSNAIEYNNESENLVRGEAETLKTQCIKDLNEIKKEFPMKVRALLSHNNEK